MHCPSAGGGESGNGIAHVAFRHVAVRKSSALALGQPAYRNCQLAMPRLCRTASAARALPFLSAHTPYRHTGACLLYTSVIRHLAAADWSTTEDLPCVRKPLSCLLYTSSFSVHPEGRRTYRFRIPSQNLKRCRGTHRFWRRTCVKSEA